MAKNKQKNVAQQDLSAESLRLDRWLWAARFFKTRALATESIKAGHIQLGGQRVKPAKGVTIGDRLEIRKGEFAFEVDVLALSPRRLSAPLAQALYGETDDSVARREKQQEESRFQRALGVSVAPEGRPDKRQRRLLHRFRQVRDDGA